MPVLYIADTDLATAEALAYSLGEKAQCIVMNLEQPVSIFLPPKVEEIILVAHTSDDRKKIGNKTPTQMAEEFALLLKDKKDHPLGIYLISSNAGLSREGEMSIAQQFALEMKNQGFLQLLVYAFAGPCNANILGIRLEVMTKNDLGFQPGEINAAYYIDKESERLDNIIIKLSERIDFLRIKGMSATSDERLERERKIRELVRLRQQRDSEIEYFKIDIVSAGNYKEFLKQPYNTFTAEGPQTQISNAVIMAINYLHSVRKDIYGSFPNSGHKDIEKYRTHINDDIDKIRHNATLDYQGISKLLKFRRPLLLGNITGNYYHQIRLMKEKIHELEKLLSEKMHRPMSSQPFDLPVSNQEVVSAPLVELAAAPSKPLLTITLAKDETPDASQEVTPLTTPKSVTESGLLALSHFRRSMVSENVRVSIAPYPEQMTNIRRKNELLEKLIEYKTTRESEWGYHFNILYFKTLLYYIIDCIGGTNYSLKRSKDVKLSAATKLINCLRSDHLQEEIIIFETSEKDALNDGRLGQLVTQDFGGLDRVLSRYTAHQSETGNRLNFST